MSFLGSEAVGIGADVDGSAVAIVETLSLFELPLAMKNLHDS